MAKRISKEERAVIDLKKKIDKLLMKYNKRKEDAQWAEDDWEISLIQEDLDGFAREITKLQAKVKEYQHA
jgi:hypothetical protein